MYYALCFPSIWHKRQITFNDLGDAIFYRLLYFLQPLIVTSCRLKTFYWVQAGVPTIQAVVVIVFKALVFNLKLFP
jgi:hypothetical protein